MFSNQKDAQKPGPASASVNGQAGGPAIPLLSVVGERARMEGKFDIADSIQVECEVGGEMTVGGKLVIGEKGVVNANVQTVDAIIKGSYQGNMIATGNVEITSESVVMLPVTRPESVISTLPVAIMLPW